MGCWWIMWAIIKQIFNVALYKRSRMLSNSLLCGQQQTPLHGNELASSFRSHITSRKWTLTVTTLGWLSYLLDSHIMLLGKSQPTIQRETSCENVYDMEHIPKRPIHGRRQLIFSRWKHDWYIQKYYQMGKLYVYLVCGKSPSIWFWSILILILLTWTHNNFYYIS